MKSSELVKAKELPPGYHNHGGTANPHPADKPHRPGTQQEKWHLEHGLTNTWYEQHGTTREEYVKEHGEPEAKPRKKPERKPKEPKEKEPKEEAHDPEKVKQATGGTIGWKANRSLIETHPELTTKTKEAKELMQKLESEGHPPRYVLRECLRYMGENLRQDVDDMLSKQPEELQKEFVHSIMDGVCNDPIGKGVLGRMFVGNPKKAGKTNAYFRTQSMQMCFYENNTFKEKNQTWWPETVYDPVREENTQWFWSFPECKTASVFAHEYGHCISSSVSTLKGLLTTFDFSERYGLKDRLMPDLNVNIVSKGRDAREDALYILDNDLYYQRGSDGKEMAEKVKAIIDRHPEYIATIERAEIYGREYDNVVVLKKNPKEAYRKLMEKHGNLETALQKEIGEVDYSYKQKQSVARDKECERVYEKLFGKGTCVPTDVYTQYGTYAGAPYTWKDDTRKAKISAKRAEERFAEAYWDVTIRGDKANTMSKMLVAHSYYEQEKLLNGYEGTFEEYLKDKVGIDKSTERIIKSYKEDSIRKHRAFIMSVSKQFDNKVRKSGLTHVGIVEREQLGEKWILIDGYSHAKTLRGVKSDVKATLMQYSPSEAEGLDRAEGDEWIVPQSEGYKDEEYTGYYLDVEEVHEGLWYVHGFVQVY